MIGERNRGSSFAMPKGADNPAVTLVAPTATGVSPPRKLGQHGLSLWNSVQSAYRIDDAGGVELLAQACAAQDRVEALAEAINRDGEVVQTRAGPKAHPALRDELAGRAFIVRTLEHSASTSKLSSRWAARRIADGTMPTNRTPIRHPARNRLNHDREMVLRYGPDPRWPTIRSEAEYRDAWARHRERLLEGYQHGRRPIAWWRFEAPFPYPGYDREPAVLFEAKLLSDAEAQGLETWWREQFERAQDPNFFHCEGPGRFLKGEAARRAHHRWAGIPRSLLRKWTAQRRRQSKTVRELEAAVAEQPSPAA